MNKIRRDKYMEQPTIYDKAPSRMLVYDKYVVAEIGDGIDIYKKEADFLNEVAQKHFEDKFGLIDNRINNVSVNPEIWEYMKKTIVKPKMVAFAVVSSSDITEETFFIEKIFHEQVGIKSRIFTSLEEAKKWMEEMLS